MKVAVLLSGGVDSSVVLALLKDRRYDVTAFYLKIWLEEETAFLGDCPWEEDLHYARSVCEQMDVPLEILPLQQEYYDRVVSYALAELNVGRTPSPDIFCNQRIKFGAFYDHIDDSFTKVATGHYAEIHDINGTFHLQRAVDPVKDQTYFLSHLSQAQLQRALFLLGGFPKAKVRELAETYHLPTKDRKDSQGICFLGKIKYNEFIKFNLGEKTGDIIEWESGKILGHHQGAWYHTIGQRQGLRLGGGPWFVVKKDMEQNIVYVTHQDHLAQQARSTFEVGSLHWIADPPAKTNLQTKLRHGPAMYACRIAAQEEDRLSVTLDQADPGVAPGQFAVFYDGDECLGAGTIL